MKLKYTYILICCCLTNGMNAFLDYDRAVHAAQQGDWHKADTMLSALITDRPDQSDLLYDAGVAACEKKDFKRACTCFSHACSSSTCSPVLKEQAHFNCGNACVELKELKQAITEYEKVLQLNPKNDHARHNLEVVKKMLEQQQQQDHNKDQDKDQNKDKQDQDKQDQNNKDDKNQQDKNKQDKNQQDQKNKQDQQDKQDKNNDQNQDKNNDQQKNENKSDRDQEKKSNDKKSQDEQSQDQKSEQPKKDEQKPQQDKTADQQTKDKQQQHKQQEKAGGAEQKYDEQVMNILNAVEKKDAQANKKMMAAQIKQAVGQYDKHKNNY